MKLLANEVLSRYKSEDLPEFLEVELVDVNQRGNFGNCPLHVAAVRGDVEEIEALVAGGANVNAAGELGNTPLHEAAIQGNIKAVEALLPHGAEPEATNEAGDTPLSLALALGHSAVASTLDMWRNRNDRKH